MATKTRGKTKTRLNVNLDIDLKNATAETLQELHGKYQTVESSNIGSWDFKSFFDNPRCS
ncbi:hypothetical protein OfM2_13990 [Lactovum odontotermitis]